MLRHQGGRSRSLTAEPSWSNATKARKAAASTATLGRGPSLTRIEHGTSTWERTGRYTYQGYRLIPAERNKTTIRDTAVFLLRRYVSAAFERVRTTGYHVYEYRPFACQGIVPFFFRFPLIKKIDSTICDKMSTFAKTPDFDVTIHDTFVRVDTCHRDDTFLGQSAGKAIGLHIRKCARLLAPYRFMAGYSHCLQLKQKWGGGGGGWPHPYRPIIVLFLCSVFLLLHDSSQCGCVLLYFVAVLSTNVLCNMR